MPIKSAVFMGIPETAVAMQPWITSPPLCSSGVPLGLSMETRASELFDPWGLKEERKIHSTIFEVVGQKDHGKSTLLKHLTANLRNMQAGSTEGRPIRMRVRIHDRKREAGEPEYAPLTRRLGGRVVSLNQTGLINIFDPAMGMDQLDLIEISTNVYEQVTGLGLIDHQMLALQVGIWMMQTKMRHISNPETLEVALRSLKLKDVKAYFDASNQYVLEMFDTFGTRTEHSEELDYLKLCMDKPINLTENELQRDAELVSEAFGRLLRGDFGRVIGGTNSLRDVLKDPVVDIDWSGVPDKARTLIEAMFWKWQDIAQNKDEVDIIPHIEIGDEEHEAFGNLMHVRFYSAYIAKARQLHTARFIGTQFETDLLMAGEPGSEIRRLSEKIVRGIAGHFIGRMPNDDETKERILRLGISEYDFEFLTIIPMGCFGVKLPDRPIVFVQITPTPTILNLSFTNTAAQRMTNRVPWMSIREVRERAALAGLLDR